MFCLKKIYARAIQDYLVHLTKWMMTLSALLLAINIMSADAMAQTGGGPPSGPCPNCMHVSIPTILKASSHPTNLLGNLLSRLGSILSVINQLATQNLHLVTNPGRVVTTVPMIRD